MRRVRYLKIEERVHQFTLDVFKAAKDLPPREAALINRIKQEAVSISSSIVEGCKVANAEEAALAFLRAILAFNRLEYLLLLANDLEYLSRESHQSLRNELSEIRDALDRCVNSLYFFE